MRSRCPNYMDFAGLQIHFLFRVLQEQPHVAFQNVKSIGDIGVTVPRHLLRRRELQLHNAKAGARGMLNATLHLAKMTGVPTSAVRLGDRDDLAQLVAEIVVHRDRLIVRFKSDHADERTDSPDGSVTIPWKKPPSRRSRQILLPHNASRSDVRPERFERRARLVSAIARGRRWLDDVVSGRVTTVAQLCARGNCSVRQVNMT